MDGLPAVETGASRHLYAYANADRDNHSVRNTYANGIADRDRCANLDRYRHANCDNNSVRYTYCDGDRNTDRYANRDRYAYSFM